MRHGCGLVVRLCMDAASVEKAIDRSVELLGLQLTLKDEQRDAIRTFVSGRDVFVALPTGFGKSLYYALLPPVFDELRGRDQRRSIVIVVSPLTSLMMEQRQKFTTDGIPAEFVGELQQDLDAMQGVKDGKYQLLYISPESLLSNPQWRNMLLSTTYRKNIVGLVVDEAHCVTQW